MTLLIHNSSFAPWASVAHFGPGRIRPFRDQLEAAGRFALRAPCADGIFIQDLHLIFLDPHQLKALRTGTDLRSHNIPLTLLRDALSPPRETNLVQDAIHPQER